MKKRKKTIIKEESIEEKTESKKRVKRRLKKKFRILFIIVCICFISSIIVVFVNLKFMEYVDRRVSLEQDPNLKDDKNKVLVSENGIINIDFKEVNDSISVLNTYVNNNIKDEYYTILTNLMTTSLYQTKIYEEENLKIVELIIKKNILISLFNSSIDLGNIETDDVIVKMTFDKNVNFSNMNIDEIYFQANKEEITRKKVVEVALAQLGNTGEKYWEWYGFSGKIAWCAAFVSWVANENGLIDDGLIPKFLSCRIGANWFKERDLYRKKSEYTPKPGDVIFFNFTDGINYDHVGLVEKVSDGMVYTIEGNASEENVKNRKYPLTSRFILGYGTPLY